MGFSDSCGWWAKFQFRDLCSRALGAADYIELANIFPTIYLADVPQLSMQERNEVRRFITLIDSLYEGKVRLLVNAAAPANELLMVDDEHSTHDEIFAFDRTVSRLAEMSSAEYQETCADDWAALHCTSAEFLLPPLSAEQLLSLWRKHQQVVVIGEEEVPAVSVPWKRVMPQFLVDIATAITGIPPKEIDIDTDELRRLISSTRDSEGEVWVEHHSVVAYLADHPLRVTTSHALRITDNDS